ncbi:unnamed protein product [Calypogeia fissa]
MDFDNKFENWSKKPHRQRIMEDRLPLTDSWDAALEEADEYTAKYRIYERDYLRRINHKYFSGRNLAGTGRVFDIVTTVEGGFRVTESRESPIKRFLESPNFQEEQSSKSGGTLETKQRMTRKSQ